MLKLTLLLIAILSDFFAMSLTVHAENKPQSLLDI